MENTMNTQETKRRSVTVGLPKREFELIDSNGNAVARSVSGLTIAIIAVQMFPDQMQDPDRTGEGWDVQVAS